MITFRDGPAAGHTLLLQRAPLYLRVTRDAQGTIDALDMPEDEPQPGETLFAYVRMTDPERVHLRMAPPRRSGFYARAEYALVEPQPEDAVMRDRDRWCEWASAQTRREQP